MSFSDIMDHHPGLSACGVAFLFFGILRCALLAGAYHFDILLRAFIGFRSPLSARSSRLFTWGLSFLLIAGGIAILVWSWSPVPPE